MPMKEESTPFVIEAEEVNRLHKASGLALEAFIATLVEPTRSLARAPISNFHVGVVGLGGSGRVFRGVNVEFAGLPLSHSIHAEQFLVANAARNGEKSLKFLAVSAAPCGHCRQFLQELRNAGDLRVLILDSKAETHELSYFLPDRFGPQDLLEDDFPLLLEPQDNRLVLNPSQIVASPQVVNGIIPSGDSRIVSSEKLYVALPALPERVTSNGDTSSAMEGNLSVRELIQSLNSSAPASSTSSNKRRVKISPQQRIELRNAALEAANSSYSPYSTCPSGLSFITTKDNVYCGSYFESAAYNPSLPPLQSSIIAFLAEGGGNPDEIRHAVLVEKEGALVQQAATVQLALAKISPLCSFEVLEAVTFPISL